MTEITVRHWGVTKQGEPVQLYTLKNDSGMKVGVTTYGGTIVFLEVPDQNGRPTDVVLGYDCLNDYERGDKYLGATIGRYANRIGSARFQLNGKEYPLTANEGKNHLHGGRRLRTVDCFCPAKARMGRRAILETFQFPLPFP